MDAFRRSPRAASSCSSAPMAARSAGSPCRSWRRTAGSWSSPTSSTAPIASSRSTEIVARPPVFVLTAEDPRVSHRAHEAMRIALGVVAGDNDVSIVLAGPGVHLLDEDTDELVDGDDVAKVRTSLRKLGVPFHVEATSLPSDSSWNPDAHPVTPIGAEGIAALAARASRFIVF